MTITPMPVDLDEDLTSVSEPQEEDICPHCGGYIFGKRARRNAESGDYQADEADDSDEDDDTITPPDCEFDGPGDDDSSGEEDSEDDNL